VGNGQTFRVLTNNSGSSSIKFSLYEMGEDETRLLSGALEQLGSKNSLFHAEGRDGKTLIQQHRDLPAHAAALSALFDWLQRQGFDKGLDAVGHRLVHGGAAFREAHLVTKELLAKALELRPFDPATWQRRPRIRRSRSTPCGAISRSCRSA